MNQWKFDSENFYSFASVDNPFFWFLKIRPIRKKIEKYWALIGCRNFDSLEREILTV
jgi:hypothetical protein